MKLSIFSLQDVIQEYNEENGSQYSVDENFNLISLSNDALVGLNQNLKALGEIIHHINSDQNSYVQFRDQIDDSHLKHVKEREDWYDSQIARFEKEDYWDELLADDQLTKSRRKILVGLKKLWFLQKDHVYHRSSELEYIVTKILPGILEYISCATKECRHKNSLIPEVVCQKFFAYLENLSGEIRAYQASLLKSMMVRLKIASDSRNWKLDDAVMYVSKKINQQRPIFNSMEGMNLKTFCLFFNYIFLNGSIGQKVAMFNESWFDPDVDFCKVKHGKRYCLVPKEMVSVTPRFYFSSKLFAQRYFRHNLFHENIGLILRLKTLNTHTKVSKHMSVANAEKLFEDLMELEMEFKRVHAVVESWRSVSWKRYFRRKTDQFVSLFAHFAFVHARKITEKKLEVIHVLRLRVEADYLESNLTNQSINLNLINRAIQLCEEFWQVNKAAFKNESLISQFEDDQAYFHKMLSLGKSDVIPSATAEKKPEFAPDVDCEDTEDCSSEIRATPKEIQAKGIFEAVAQVNPTTLTDRDFDHLMSMFERTIEGLPAGATEDHLNVALSKYFISYLECCHQFETHDQFMLVKERVQKIENLLEHRGPAFIKSRVLSMIKLRDQESDWFGFKTLSGIYLQSCALEEKSQFCLN